MLLFAGLSSAPTHVPAGARGALWLLTTYSQSASRRASEAKKTLAIVEMLASLFGLIGCVLAASVIGALMYDVGDYCRLGRIEPGERAPVARA